MSKSLVIEGENPNKSKLREAITLICPFPDQMIPIGKEGNKDHLKRLLYETGFDYLTYCYGEKDEEEFKNKNDEKLDHFRKEIGINGDGKVELNKVVDFLANE